MKASIEWLVVVGCCIVLVLLWLPGLRYPIVSDTAFYALLGESFWHGHGYMLFGEPYAKHLPFHAILSYPLVWALGYGIGMKVSSLLAGFGVLFASYMIAKHASNVRVALAVTALLTIHHGFVLMTMLGSADLLFAALFLFSVLMYMKAGEDRKWYLFAFMLAGCASVTRYNGAPLFVLFLGHTLLFRRDDIRSFYCWMSAVIGSAIFGLWFLRNYLIFGDPLYTEYTSELSGHVSSIADQMVLNGLYYLNPLHNILPILLVCALIGLWNHWREQKFLIAVMLTAWVLTSFWWVQGIRFAFAGYPILILFAVLGIVDLKNLLSKFTSFWFLVFGLVAITHGGALCLYSYGSCNAWFDRTFDFIPKDLHLSSEGFHTWDQARDYINEHAEEEAYVFAHAPENLIVWKEGVFRSDLQLTIGDECPVYHINNHAIDKGEVVFESPDYPKRAVVLERCP